MYKILSNSKGMSLVQVMIAGAMMAGLAVVGMKMFSNQQKMTLKLKSNTNISEFRSNILSLLSNSTTCTNALEGISLGEEFIKVNFFDKNTPYLSKDDTIPGSSLQIVSFELLTDAEAISAELPTSPASNDGTKVVNLKIRVTNTNPSVIGGRDKNLYFKIIAKVGDLNVISDITIKHAKESCYDSLGGVLLDDDKNSFDSYKNTNEEDPLFFDGTKYYGLCLAPPSTTTPLLVKCGN